MFLDYTPMHCTLVRGISTAFLIDVSTKKNKVPGPAQ